MASTVAGTTLDTQLFLFDSAGHGVYANDDAPGVMGQSALPAGVAFTPAAAGVYSLAITRYNQDPVTLGGSRLFPDVIFTTGPQPSMLTGVVEAKQFDAFNRMSAFVVHDLKNLVAQLSLMLRNAERHRHNPEFQRDMLGTWILAGEWQK